MSDAPKDAKKPAAAQGKPAAAADKKAAAPSKGAAKGAAKGGKAGKADKKKRTPETLRKKNKTPLQTPKPDPKKAVRKERLATITKQKAEAKTRRAAYGKVIQQWNKAIKLAKKEKKPLPPRPKAPKVKKTRTTDFGKKHQRRFLKLTPLNQQFLTNYGFLFSEFIGKAREKALSARNVNVIVHRKGHPLNGRRGKLIYYTGKHQAFVRIGLTRFKLPFSILVRRSVFERKIRVQQVKQSNARRLRFYNRIAANYKQKADEAKAAGGKAPTQPKLLGAPFKETKYTPVVRKWEAEAQKKKDTKAKKPKATGHDTLPAAPYRNVGNAPTIASRYYKAQSALKKKLAEAKKSGNKTKRDYKARAAAVAKKAAAPAQKAAAPAQTQKAAPAAKKA